MQHYTKECPNGQLPNVSDVDERTNGAASFGLITPEELATRHEFQREIVKGKPEWHGRNPDGGADENGFWLRADGSGYDRKTGTNYTQPEIAKLFGISPDHYAPCAEWKAQNGHKAHANGQGEGRTPKPIKTPSERGLTPETLAFFGVGRVESTKFDGWKYPTFHVNGAQGRMRFKNAKGKPKYKWWPGGDEREPHGYNLQNVPKGAPLVDIVGGEVDVWTAHQNDFLAVCTFGETQGATALVAALVARGVERARITLDADTAGDSGAAELARECHKQGLAFTLRRFAGGDGHDVCDEFSRVGFDREKFRAAFEALPEIEIPPETDEQPPAPMFEVWSYKQLRSKPRLSWLIDQILPVGGTSWLTAGAGELKSFWAIDAACCVASGRRFHGRAVKRGNVVYVAAEGSTGLPDRLEAWAAKHQTEVPDAPALGIITKPADVAAPAVWAGFADSIRALEPVFIVLDTQSRCSVGRDLNSTSEASVFYDAVSRLALELGAQILIVAHNNRSGQYAGNHQGPAMVDTHLTMKRDGNRAQLRCSKQKDGAAEELAAMDFQTLIFQLDGRDEQGRSVTSLALESIEIESEPKADARDKNEEVRGAMLEALRQHFPKGAGAQEWQLKCAELKICQKTAFYERRDELKTNGRIMQIRGVWLANDAPSSPSSLGSHANPANLPDLLGSPSSRSSSPVGTTNPANHELNRRTPKSAPDENEEAAGVDF